MGQANSFHFPGAARLYYLKLYQGDADGSNMKLVRNFRSVRLVNGLVVLWDFVEKKPYLPQLASSPGTYTNFPVAGALRKVLVLGAGAAAGKEVVQLYVACPDVKVGRCVKELKAFAKLALAPGETKTVEMRLTPRCFIGVGPLAKPLPPFPPRPAAFRAHAPQTVKIWYNTVLSKEGKR